MASNGTAAALTPAQRNSLVGAVVTTPFGPDDRLYRDYREFNTLYEESELDLTGVRRMLGTDGNPRKLEQVLTLPIRGAPWEIRGSGPAAGLVRANLTPLIGQLIDQATSAISYQKAFFETEWQLDAGQVVYKGLHMRPAVSCEAAFDEQTGRADGFRQQLAATGLITVRRGDDGWARVHGNRAFIYTHGTHREPLRGISDLDVALWCWDNIRKLSFLWWQYLEQQSLPKVLAYGDSPGEAQTNATNIAKAKASATIPVERRGGDPNQRMHDVIESSGKGADQFIAAISWLESRQTRSVLASFTDLAQAATQGRGSNALSADQSEFFLGSRQAVADELAAQITDGVIRPLVANNYGPDVEVPTLAIGPIGNRQTDRALAMLDTLIVAPSVNAPDNFVGYLINHTASFLGLDSDKIAEAVEQWEAKRAEQAERMAQQMQQQPAGQQPAADPAGQAQLTHMTRAIGLSTELVRRARDGEDPADVLAEMLPRSRAARRVELADAEPKQTGGMVALLPDAESARRLLVEGGEPLEQLHLTLCYLGDDVTGWSQPQRDQVLERARMSGGRCGPVEARAFAHATFNPDAHADRKPCAVYLIGDSEAIPELNMELRGLASALQHPGFVAHVTAGYDRTAADLDYTGPVTFDRLGVFFGDERIEIPLTRRVVTDGPQVAF